MSCLEQLVLAGVPCFKSLYIAPDSICVVGPGVNPHHPLGYILIGETVDVDDLVFQMNTESDIDKWFLNSIGIAR